MQNRKIIQLLILLSISFVGCHTKDELTETKSIDSIFINECFYSDLSEIFDYHIKFTRREISDFENSSIIFVQIFEKQTHLVVDTISFTTDYLLDNLEDCNSVRSYITEKNTKVEIFDNVFEDFIIADFNFDNKEDIAIVNDYGGNNGTCYNYYIQGDNQKFYFDSFLTNEVQWFPVEFNVKNKTLTTVVRVNTFQDVKTTYKYFDDNTWKQLNRKYIEY